MNCDIMSAKEKEADVYISDALCVNKYRIIFKMEVKGNGYIFKSRQ